MREGEFKVELFGYENANVAQLMRNVDSLRDEHPSFIDLLVIDAMMGELRVTIIFVPEAPIEYINQFYEAGRKAGFE